MKKLLNAGLLITSLFGYLAWGKDQHAFLFQTEAEVLAKAIDNPLSVLHPFTVFPILGQILLLITLFQKEPRRWMSLLGLACVSMIMILLLVVGVMGLNAAIAVSTLPFLITAFFVLKENRKGR